MTIDKLYNIFLTEKEVSCSNETIVYYSYNLNRFINYLTELKGCSSCDIDITEVDRGIIGDFILSLRSSNCYATHPTITSDHRIKNTSINTYMRAVKIFINWCYLEGFLEADLFRSVKLPKQDPANVIPLYAAEVARIDSCFNLKTESGLRNWCILHLMLDIGLRRGEVIGLQLNNIMFDKNIIYVYGKGGKYRIVPLVPRLKSNLYRYCVLYRSLTDSENVFVKVGSMDYINKSTINQLFRRIKLSTGIDRLHPHLLRHTFATSYILGGGNLEFLRLLMGHSDYNITKRYLHLANQCSLLQADLYKLDSSFFKKLY